MKKTNLIKHLISQLESEQDLLLKNNSDIEILDLEKEELINYCYELFGAIAEPAVDIFLDSFNIKKEKL